MNKYDQGWKQLKDHCAVTMSELADHTCKAARSLEEKRRQALEYLGSDHVLHPEYQGRARHSPLKDIWEPHRALFDVQIKASIAGRI